MPRQGPPSERLATQCVTARWADFVARSQWSDLPAAVRHEGKRSLLNMLGASLGAASHPDLERLIGLLAAVAGPAAATVLGRAERLDILHAAFVNAISANLSDFDDTHLGTGESWEITKNAYKPYPCGIVLHPVIDACFLLRDKYALAAADVAAVTVAGHPLLLARADRPVANARDAKISIQHSVAAVFLFGAAGVREYSDAVVMHPSVVAFRERVHAEIDPGMAVGAARVNARTTGGKLLSTQVMHARGSLQLPMTDAQIESKVRELAAIGCPACDVDRIIDAVWELDRADDVRPLMRLVAAA
jgi:2-methylcitrate dehydratase PrpD